MINGLRFCMIIGFLCFTLSVNGFTIKNLKAHYRNGQVFLVWKNADVTNLQYHVYRSVTKFTSASQLNSDSYLGFVVDSSSKNYRLSTLDGVNISYRWNVKGSPVAAGKGLYAITCMDDAAFYYAVMVEDNSTGIEEKSIIGGENSLSLPVSETVIKPQPVLQDSVLMPSGIWKYRYVQYCNNQETPLYPAMNSTGSYGFNFFIIKRGTLISAPLMVSYQGDDLAASADVSFESQFDNCWILGVDDWLPIRYSDGRFGDNVYYCCYHEHFNIYTDKNPIPSSGIIKTYPQKRVMESIKWLRDQFGIDSTSIYVRGSSHSGIAALFTAMIYPGQIAAYYGIVEPVSLSTNGDSVYEQMWGLDQTDLNTDVINYKTGQFISFNRLTTLKKMLGINAERSIPVVFDVHGKNDQTIQWNSGKVEWLDSLDDNHYGGSWYWDQRQHNGDGKDFSANETLPDFLRYHTTKSYPAFSNCSINQNPGNGKKTSGDDYGAYNGYLDFDDDITDDKCEYDVTVFIKNFYVGGTLDATQYNTCTSEVTFRRLQHFVPESGTVVKWKNYDSSSSVIQSGSFTASGNLITIKDVTINKSGNRIQLSVNGCTEKNTSALPPDQKIDFIKTPAGYEAVIFSGEFQEVTGRLIDLTGRTVSHLSASLHSGSNSIKLNAPQDGLYIIELRSPRFTESHKLIF